MNGRDLALFAACMVMYAAILVTLLTGSHLPLIIAGSIGAVLAFGPQTKVQP